MQANKSKKSVQLWIISVLALLIFLALTRKRTSLKAWPENEILDVFNQSKYKQFASYLVAQSKLESANYSSRLFTTYYNAFGMNCVAKRPTMQIGCTAGVFDGKMSKGIYRSPSDSARDMVKYLDYNNAPISFDSLKSFNAWMKSKGFYQIEESEYLKRMQTWM